MVAMTGAADRDNSFILVLVFILYTHHRRVQTWVIELKRRHNSKVVIPALC